MGPVDPEDLRVRRATYQAFVDLGGAPAPADLAAATGASEHEIVASWRRLHDLHALVLDDERERVRMANPFSAVPTPHRVQAAGRWWYANCAWDAVGVCAALHTDGTVVTTCADCGDEISFEIRDQRPADGTLLFHCLVPASSWWDDIGFT